jgi:hypothetical protein
MQHDDNTPEQEETFDLAHLGEPPTIVVLPHPKRAIGLSWTQINALI